MNCEILYVQAGLRKGRGTRDQIANIRWTVEKAKEFQTPTSALLTMQKQGVLVLDLLIHLNLANVRRFTESLCVNFLSLPFSGLG